MFRSSFAGAIFLLVGGFLPKRAQSTLDVGEEGLEDTTIDTKTVKKFLPIHQLSRLESKRQKWETKSSDRMEKRCTFSGPRCSASDAAQLSRSWEPGEDPWSRKSYYITSASCKSSEYQIHLESEVRCADPGRTALDGELADKAEKENIRYDV